ncbi:hypothetical protein HDU89_008950 [Geranomyces variabilis]|nr:hypothetical protein HDU89_008950 [Geranomyces variabilis]
MRTNIPATDAKEIMAAQGDPVYKFVVKLSQGAVTLFSGVNGASNVDLSRGARHRHIDIARLHSAFHEARHFGEKSITRPVFGKKLRKYAPLLKISIDQESTHKNEGVFIAIDLSAYSTHFTDEEWGFEE